MQRDRNLTRASSYPSQELFTDGAFNVLDSGDHDGWTEELALRMAGIGYGEQLSRDQIIERVVDAHIPRGARLALLAAGYHELDPRR